MKKYIAVPVKMKEEDFDIALFTFDNYPYTGVEELFDELKITFDEEDYSEDLKNQIAADLKEAGIEFSFGENEIIEDQNWMEEWEKQLKPFRANDRIAFCPSMKTDEIDAEIKIIVDPKMSFGTGEHATTRLVAQLMDGEVEKDSFWVDAGCGTGALAVLAIKLGARECYAFDNDI
jgi:ribosomal protein L11 methyltransferase